MISHGLNGLIHRKPTVKLSHHVSVTLIALFIPFMPCKDNMVTGYAAIRKSSVTEWCDLSCKVFYRTITNVPVVYGST